MSVKGREESHNRLKNDPTRRGSARKARPIAKRAELQFVDLCRAGVAVVQPADLRYGDHTAAFGRLDVARHWSVAVEY